VCGFVGVFNNKDKPTHDLTQAAATIASRGPDMQGIQSGNNWKVAFNRLSIHDLTDAAMQPFIYDGVTVYLNGEIFNYIELLEEYEGEFTPNSGSDVEIVPFLYSKYGIDFLNKLNGMFAIVIIDKEKSTNYLVRDRFGEKPLFYHQRGDDLFFASEVKALKNLVDLKIDKLNLKINFACGFLPQNFTLYQKTFSINPGSYLEFKNNIIQKVRWYNPNIKRCDDDKETISKKFIDLYKSSIQLRLKSDVPTGIFLSGGLDSTSMAKFSVDFNKNEFFTFGADIANKEVLEGNNTDVEIPNRLSADLNFEYKKTGLNYDYYNKNIVSIIKHYDEIFMSSGVLVFYALSQLARDNKVGVIFTGVAGDELFGGYPWQSGLPRKINLLFKLFNKILPYSEHIYNMLILINKRFALAYKVIADYQVWHAESLSDFNLYFGGERKKIEDKLRDNAHDYFKISNNHVGSDVYNIMNYSNIFTNISAQNYFVDIAAMKYSVENRAPFLDHRLYEYMMSIPDSVKVESGLKGLLRDILKKYLPQYVVDAKKSGSTMPIMTWLYRDDLIKKIDIFVFKYIYVIEEYLSTEISSKIKDDSEWLFSSKNSLRLFSIISFIIWAKFNILNDVVDDNITFEEMLLT